MQLSNKDPGQNKLKAMKMSNPIKKIREIFYTALFISHVFDLKLILFVVNKNISYCILNHKKDKKYEYFNEVTKKHQINDVNLYE